MLVSSWVSHPLSLPPKKGTRGILLFPLVGGFFHRHSDVSSSFTPSSLVYLLHATDTPSLHGLSLLLLRKQVFFLLQGFFPLRLRLRNSFSGAFPVDFPLGIQRRPHISQRQSGQDQDRPSSVYLPGFVSRCPIPCLALCPALCRKRNICCGRWPNRSPPRVAFLRRLLLSRIIRHILPYLSGSATLKRRSNSQTFHAAHSV